MKLRDARLCLNLKCNEVFEGERACPGCGGRQWKSISAWLNREDGSNGLNSSNRSNGSNDFLDAETKHETGMHTESGEAVQGRTEL